jgi:hypothetical protein
MLKSIANMVAGLSLFVLSAPFASAATVPLLSGTYVYASQIVCQMPLTASYSSASASSPKGAPVTVVSQITSGSGPNAQSVGAGTLVFVHGAGGSGTVTVNGVNIDGSAVYISNVGTGAGGAVGSHVGSETTSGKGTFTQTATTLTTNAGGASTYHVYYGKVAGGIAQYAVFAGIDSQGCAAQYTITHR